MTTNGLGYEPSRSIQHSMYPKEMKMSKKVCYGLTHEAWLIANVGGRFIFLIYKQSSTIHSNHL